jgi:hypothetical protein
MQSGMESRRLSSRLTEVYRYGVPALVALWGLGTTSALISRGGGSLPLAIHAVVVLLSAALVLGYYWLIGRAKHVELCGDQLIVRGFGQSIHIPLCDVASVGGSRFTNPERVWLDLRTPGPFGSRIHFIPPQRWIRFASVHPLVAELQQLVAAGSTAEAPPAPRVDERSSALRVALALIAVAILGLLIAGFAVGTLRASEPYSMARSRVQSDPRVLKLLGEPTTTGWWVMGSLKRSGGDGYAELRFPLHGPDRQATVEARATASDGVWRLDHVSVRSGGQRIEVVGTPGPE